MMGSFVNVSEALLPDGKRTLASSLGFRLVYIATSDNYDI